VAGLGRFVKAERIGDGHDVLELAQGQIVDADSHRLSG
jgi:hypothetical protein